MINFFSCFPILFSLSLSFLLHAILNLKQHIHSFFGHAITFSSNNNITDDQLYHSVSSTANDLMICTQNIGFESIDNDERIVDVDDDQIDGEYCTAEEGRGNGRKAETSFPPPLSSLDGNGQPSFILSPVRKNGRLQLRKVRIKRPEIMYATRQDGRLRLYLVPDDYDDDDVEEQEWEVEEEEIIKIDDDSEEEEEKIVEEEEIMKVEESEEEEEMVEEEMSRVREWKGGDNERFRRCYELVNHIHCINHVHSHHNLHMFGLSIA